MQMHRMRYMPAQPNIPLSQATLLRGLGARVREARQRRSMSMVLLAAGAGITRPTLARLEAGEPSTTLGTLVQVLSVLGIGGELALLVRGIADPALGTQQAPAQGAGTQTTGPSGPVAGIKLADYPVLQSLAWHMGGPAAQVTREQALALYERHWHHVSPEDMGPAEQTLLNDLKANEGQGVLLV